MIIKNIRLALHNINADKLNFSIAILGLAIGLVAATLLTSYCLYFFNYDRNVTNPDEWYRLRLTTSNPEDGEINSSEFYSDTAGAMIKEIPDIKEYLVYNRVVVDVQLYCDGKTLFMGNRANITPGFIKHYKMKFIYGNPDTLFNYQSNIIISRSYSERYFGKENPVGKIIYNRVRNVFVISGVFEDLPDNLHLRNDVYRKMETSDTMPAIKPQFLRRDYIRVQIPDPSAVPRVEKAFNELFVKNPFFGYDVSRKTVKLDPITRIHFMPGLKDDLPTMSRTNIYAVMVIGILILLASILNFLNLILLAWQKRSDEFSFRRSVGADKGDIFRQLVTEYGVYFLLAVVLAVGLYYLTADIFAGMVGLHLQPYSPDKGALPFIIIAFLLIVGSVTGTISAYRFSNRDIFNPEYRFRSRETGNFAILFMQTVIGYLFIAMALIVVNQMLFVRHHDPGFDTKNTLQYKLITIIGIDHPSYIDGAVVRARIRSLPGVIKESASDLNLASEELEDGQVLSGLVEAPIKIENLNYKERMMVYGTGVDVDFFKTRGIKLLQGRIPDVDSNTETLINRTFAEKYFPHSTPLGKSFKYDEADLSAKENPLRTIAGVVEDCWFFPLHTPMPPMFYVLKPQSYNYFQVTYTPGKKAEMAARLDSLFTDITRNKIFAFSSVDVPQQQQLYYKDDNTYMRLTVFFALIIALISGMGIYAISSLHIRHQMKDIAIRKVSGAEFKDLFRLYMKSYLILLATAGFTGLVAAYYLSKLFLDRFALKAAYPWYMYPLTVVILLLLVMVPLYFNLLKAWRTDPNRYLQTE